MIYNSFKSYGWFLWFTLITLSLVSCQKGGEKITPAMYELELYEGSYTYDGQSFSTYQTDANLEVVNSTENEIEIHQVYSLSGDAPPPGWVEAHPPSTLYVDGKNVQGTFVESLSASNVWIDEGRIVKENGNYVIEGVVNYQTQHSFLDPGPITVVVVATANFHFHKRY